MTKQRLTTTYIVISAIAFPTLSSAADDALPRVQASAPPAAPLFKANGICYLGAADTYQGRYCSMVAQSASIYGPYTKLQEAVPCGGGTNYFRDNQGAWWCCFFGNDTQAPWREKPGIVKIESGKGSEIEVSASQPSWVVQ